MNLLQLIVLFKAKINIGIKNKNITYIPAGRVNEIKRARNERKKIFLPFLIKEKNKNK